MSDAIQTTGFTFSGRLYRTNGIRKNDVGPGGLVFGAGVSVRYRLRR